MESSANSSKITLLYLVGYRTMKPMMIGDYGYITMTASCLIPITLLSKVCT